MRDPSRRGRQDLPSSRRQPLGHACLFAEQGNRVRIPDTEGISSLRLQPMNHRVQRGWQNSESSCISKVLFSVQRNLRAVKTGHWKGCHGSERRLKQCVCAKKRTRSQRLQGFTRMNGSVRRPTKSKTGETQASQQEAAMLKSYQRVCTAKICHRSDDWRNHRFCCFCGSLSLR